MPIIQEKELERFSPLPREIDPDHELVDELSRRLDAVCRYADNMAHSEGDPELQQVWRDLEDQEQNNIRKLKEMIVNRIDKGVFLNDL